MDTKKLQELYDRRDRSRRRGARPGQSLRPIITLTDGTKFDIPSCWLNRRPERENDLEYKNAAELALRYWDIEFTHLITLTYYRAVPSHQKFRMWHGLERLLDEELLPLLDAYEERKQSQKEVRDTGFTFNPSALQDSGELQWTKEDQKVKVQWEKYAEEYDSRCSPIHYDSKRKMHRKKFSPTIDTLLKDVDLFRRAIIRRQGGNCPCLSIMEDYDKGNAHHHILTTDLHLDVAELESMWLRGRVDIDEVSPSSVPQRVKYLLKTFGEKDWDQRCKSYRLRPWLTEYDKTLEDRQW